jgi:hypothetical protein
LEQLEKMKRKTMFRAQDGVLGYMLYFYFQIKFVYDAYTN